MDMALGTPEAYSWHLPEILMVLMGCHLLQNDFSRRILDAAASKKLIHMNADSQNNAVIRIVGLVHSLVVGLASLYLLLSSWMLSGETATYQQRLWGYNDTISRVNACCIGYYLWEMVILLLDSKHSKGMALHCCCALLLLTVVESGVCSEMLSKWSQVLT